MNSKTAINAAVDHVVHPLVCSSALYIKRCPQRPSASCYSSFCLGLAPRVSRFVSYTTHLLIFVRFGVYFKLLRERQFERFLAIFDMRAYRFVPVQFSLQHCPVVCLCIKHPQQETGGGYRASSPTQQQRTRGQQAVARRSGCPERIKA